MAAPAYVGTFTYIGANASTASGNRVYAGGSLVVRISTPTAATTLNTLTYGGINLLPYLEAQVNNTLRMWLFVVPASALSSLTPSGPNYSFAAGWSGTTSVGYGLAEYTGTIYDVTVQAQVYSASGSTVVDTLDLPADSTTIQDVIWNVSSGGTTPNSSQNERDDRGGGGVVRAYYDFSTASLLSGHTLQLTQTNVAHAHITVTLLGAPVSGTDDLDADDLDVEVELDEPALGQVHALAPTELGATVQLDVPGLGQVHALVGVDLVVGAQLDVPGLGQVHALVGDEITVEVELDSPALAIGNHALVGVDLNVGVQLDTPTLAQIHALVGQDLTLGITLDVPTLGQIHALLGDELTVEVELDSPSLAIGVHALVGLDLNVGLQIDAPPLGQIHALDGASLILSINLDAPLLGLGGTDQIYPVTYSHRPGKSLGYGHTPGQSLSYVWREQS